MFVQYQCKEDADWIFIEPTSVEICELSPYQDIKCSVKVVYENTRGGVSTAGPKKTECAGELIEIIQLSLLIVTLSLNMVAYGIKMVKHMTKNYAGSFVLDLC